MVTMVRSMRGNKSVGLTMGRLLGQGTLLGADSIFTLAKPFSPRMGGITVCILYMRGHSRLEPFTNSTLRTETAFRDLKGDVYPTVGMKKAGEHIRVNFGQRKFVFDIDSFVEVFKEPEHNPLF